jgi:bifunctional non-homologous end joining protein LigD
LQISDYIIGNGPAIFSEACRLGLEGIVSKRVDAVYRSGRTVTWLKIKHYAEGDFVIVGFTKSKAAGGLAALLLGDSSTGRLTFAGKVGTGFALREADALREVLRSIASDAAPVAVPKEIRREKPTWVQPKLTARVRYSGRASEGFLRHPVYRGILAAS